MFKRLTSLFLGALFFAAGSAGEAFAQEPMAAPAREIRKKPPERGPDQYPLGALEDPFQPEGLKPGTKPGLKRALPTAFNWRDNATVGTTAVKNQNPHGNCWIFGSLASLEGAVKLNESPNPDPDYSERDVGAGNAPGQWDGGHTKIVANHMSLYAPVLEGDNPYNLGEPGPPRPVSDYWNPPAGTPQLKVRQWHSLGDLDTLSDVAALKQAIYDNGPVTTSVSVATIEAWDSSFSTGGWDSSKVVPSLPTGNPTDHCVSVVGWDDDKAHHGGGGTGAWLVKNSWSSAWGSTEGGYFWIAYGSARIGATSAYYPRDGYEPYNSDEEYLYYDEFGQWGQMGWGGVYTVYCINAFTPSFSGDRFLTEVAFWAVWPELEYEIKVWDTWNRSGTPTDQLGSTVSGSVVNAGYYSIELPSPISLSSNDEIFIQVKLTNPNSDYNYLVPYEYKVSWFANNVVKESGKCYASYSQNTGWADISSSYGDLAVRGVMISSTEPTSTPTETGTPTQTPTPTLTPTPTQPPAVGSSIVVPENGQTVSGNTVTVKADIDSDPVNVNHVLFQYRTSPAGSWQEIGTDTTFPYYAHWDADTAGAGDYDLRAVAQNTGGVDDPSPGTITVTVSSTNPDISESNYVKTVPVSQASGNNHQSGDGDSDHVLHVIINSGQISGDSNLSLDFVSTGSMSGALDDYGNLDAYVDLSLSGGQTLTGQATLLFEYPPGTNADALMIYRLNTGLNRWEPCTNRTVDTGNRTISVTTDTFSTFALLEGIFPATTINKSWNIIGFPGIPHETSVQDIFGDDDLQSGGTVYVRTYNEPTGQYVDQTSLSPGKGYILWSSNESPVTVDGYGSKLYENSYTINYSYTSGNTYAGFNFASNPYNAAVDWDSEVTLNNVRNIYWQWDGSQYQFYNGADGSGGLSGAIQPFTGFWIEANGASPSITFDKPVGAGKPLLPESNPLDSPTADNWRLQVSASAGAVRDEYNFIGVSPLAAVDFDDFDVRDKTRLNSGPYIALTFPHPEWGGPVETSHYAQDVRPATMDYQVWTFQVDTNLTGGNTIRLSWPDISRIPSEWDFSLGNPASGENMDMRSNGYYDYTVSSPVQSFTIEGFYTSGVEIWSTY
jgi:C1A family cysteine protease